MVLCVVYLFSEMSTQYMKIFVMFIAVYGLVFAVSEVLLLYDVFNTHVHSNSTVLL